MNSKLVSLRGKFLKQRSASSGMSFQNLMQADFVLFIKDSLDALNKATYQGWWPETLLYIGYQTYAFENFARAQSIEYFNKIKVIFEFRKKDDFIPLLDAFEKRQLEVPRWNFTTIHPKVFLGFDKLATLP